MNGYSAVHNTRDSNRDDGTCIFVKKNVNITIVFQSRQYNAPVMKLSNQNVNLKIFTAYRASNEDEREFLKFSNKISLEHKLYSLAIPILIYCLSNTLKL